jgi:glycosyltransferase involved in cell wall biosynthesis
MAEISIVVPVFNEEGSLPELQDKLTGVLEGMGRSYEIVYVDDGSDDASLAILRGLYSADEHVRVVSFRRRYGKSAALCVGFNEASGEIIVTMDADLQDDPEEIPGLIARLEEGYDLVSGWKKKRNDPIGKTIPSKFFNRMVATATGLKLHDINCGLKVYRRAVTEHIKVYGQLHRFLPVFAHKAGFRVGELPVAHHARVHGKTKYGIGRFVQGSLDLLTVILITGYAGSPLHFFGSIGLSFTLAGFLINCYLLYLKIAYDNIRGRTPLLMLGVLLMLLGFQLVSTGLLAELITRMGHGGRKEYSIKARLSRGDTGDMGSATTS